MSALATGMSEIAVRQLIKEGAFKIATIGIGTLVRASNPIGWAITIAQVTYDLYTHPEIYEKVKDFFVRKDAAESVSKDVPQSLITSSASGSPPDPEEEDDNDDSNDENDDASTYINLKKFTQRIPHSKPPSYKDPKTNWTIQKDRAGAGGHGGSFWKLFNPSGKRVATLSQNGKILRK